MFGMPIVTLIVLIVLLILLVLLLLSVPISQKWVNVIFVLLFLLIIFFNLKR